MVLWRSRKTPQGRLRGDDRPLYWANHFHQSQRNQWSFYGVDYYCGDADSPSRRVPVRTIFKPCLSVYWRDLLVVLRIMFWINCPRVQVSFLAASPCPVDIPRLTQSQVYLLQTETSSTHQYVWGLRTAFIHRCQVLGLRTAFIHRCQVFGLRTAFIHRCQVLGLRTARTRRCQVSLMSTTISSSCPALQRAAQQVPYQWLRYSTMQSQAPSTMVSPLSIYAGGTLMTRLLPCTGQKLQNSENWWVPHRGKCSNIFPHPFRLRHAAHSL